MENKAEQRSKEWFEVRRGRLTASKFDTIVKLPRAKKDIEAGVLTDGQMTYLYEILSSILVKRDGFSNEATERGTELEAEAIKVFEKKQGVKVDSVGFVTYEEGDLAGYVGGSPDGLVGDDKIIEVKCPFNPVHHIKTCYTGQVPSQYVAQVQGNMMCTGRKMCYFISYDPRFADYGLEMKVIEIPRDEEYIKMLQNGLRRVLKVYEELTYKLLGISVKDVLDLS